MPFRGYYILDAAGEPEPCDDVLAWAQWFETHAAERILAHDKDEGPDRLEIFVSTIFLGIDHNWMAETFGGPSAPILWETRVFGGLLDGEQIRYQSRAEALVGHQAMCERVKESLIR